jgi:imidazolonepropionase-like amidohydrolase
MPIASRKQGLLLALALLVWLPQPAQAQQPDLAITGVTLIDGTGMPPQGGVTVLVEAGLVADITSADDAVIPEGTTVIDAAGKYAIPGLADMHVHFGRGGGLPNSPRSVERVLRQFLFYGVTTVLNLGAYGGATDQIAELRRRRAAGELLAPHIYATGGLLTVPGSHPINRWARSLPDSVDAESYDWSQRGVWLVLTPEEVREVVRRVAAEGMDGIKVVIESEVLAPPFEESPQMPPEMIRAAVEEAREHDLPVFAHVTSPDELEEAVEAGVRAVVHLVHPLGAPNAGLLTEMRQQGIFYIPTASLHVWADTWGEPSQNLTDPFLRSGIEESLLDALLASPMNPKVPPTESDWEQRRSGLRTLKAAYDAGVVLVGGSDTANPFVFHGYSMHHELELMVEAGLTPMEALQAATRRAAEMMREEDVWGTIEPGKRADLLLLSEDPLENIRNTRTLEWVIRGGEVIDRTTLLTDE